jgi:hypothetical protein
MSRFSDRDLLMRYHWGLGVGHIYAYQPAGTFVHTPEVNVPSAVLPESTLEENAEGNDTSGRTHDGNSDIYDSDNPELTFDDRDGEGWEDESDFDPESGLRGDHDDDIDLEETLE